MFFIKQILIIASIIIFISIYYKSESEEVVVIPEKSLRFRVIANSNSLEDYIIKNDVKNDLEKELIKLLAPAKTLTETKDILKKNMDSLNDIVLINLKNKDIDFNINLGNNHFPKKTYKGVVYPEGEYDSLVITLGNGEGNNWWCVLFPPLCLLEADEKTDEVEYKFYVSRILDYFK